MVPREVKERRRLDSVYLWRCERKEKSHLMSPVSWSSERDDLVDLWGRLISPVCSSTQSLWWTRNHTADAGLSLERVRVQCVACNMNSNLPLIGISGHFLFSVSLSFLLVARFPLMKLSE